MIQKRSLKINPGDNYIYEIVRHLSSDIFYAHERIAYLKNILKKEHFPPDHQVAVEIHAEIECLKERIGSCRKRKAKFKNINPTCSYNY